MPHQVKLRPAGELRGRACIWAAIRRLKRCTAAQLCDATRNDYGTIWRYLDGLTRAGIMERVAGTKSRQPSVWRLVRDTGVDAPRVRRNGTIPKHEDAITRVWRTMKVIGEFDCRSLAAHASLPDAAVNPNTVRGYLSKLWRAGYLARSKNWRTSTFRFVRAMNTGPKPPRIDERGRVFDGNTGQLMTAEARP